MTSPVLSTPSNVSSRLTELVQSATKTQTGQSTSASLGTDSAMSVYQDFLTTGAPNGFATLSDVFDNMTQTVGLLKKGLEGLTNMSASVGETRIDLIEAGRSDDPAAITEALDAFGELPSKLSTIAVSADYNGRSLLAEISREETVDATSLSITLVYSDYTDLSDDFALSSEDSSEQLDEALDVLDAFMDDIRAHRDDLTASFETIRGGDGVSALLSDIFPSIDVAVEENALADEGNQVLALQTRQELARSTSSLTPESQLNALRFFS